jgi:RNase P subunit RPR2
MKGQGAGFPENILSKRRNIEMPEPVKRKYIKRCCAIAILPNEIVLKI